MTFRLRVVPAANAVRGAFALSLVALLAAGAQDRLKAMPGYDQYARMQPQLQGAVKSGDVRAQWVDASKALEYQFDGKWYRFDLATKTAAEIPTPASAAPGGRGRVGFPGIERGRQAASALAPDSAHKAFYRDRNLFVSDANGANESQITTDGSEKLRIKYGTASWVYGEELGQTTAIWWSPDGKKVAYYRFDESQVPDYYLGLEQTKLQSKVDVEAYPKSGVANPVVDLFVYDIASKQSTKIDVREGKAFTNDVVGHYVYKIGWTKDGVLTMNRTNRRQNVMEFTACDATSGKCRVVVREEWPTGWVENHPYIEYLKDGKRFIWASERTGFRNFYLYDFSGKLLATLTKHEFEVENVVRVDEAANTLWYMARDGDNHFKTQLHRVGLDGKGDKRLTDPAFMHSVTLSPDAKHFVDVAQTHDEPPVTRVVDADGKLVAEVQKSDLTKYNAAGFKKSELFTYLAADGKTKLYGLIAFPSNFDPTKKYPMLASVYGGPASGATSERFALPSATAEYGFLMLTLDSRAAPGMGKRTLDAIYLKLGQTEMDDMAEGVKALWSRPYVDKARVGIYGTSYGGYSAAMELVRHPEVFAAASASSPVTDWRHYDTIYTERYMWIPQENAEGYDKGSVMKYAADLKGRLMLYFGTADNNVHPSNMMQLIQSLQRAGKSFEVQLGPDAGHSGINSQRMMEFFIENLVMKPVSAAM